MKWMAKWKTSVVTKLIVTVLITSFVPLAIGMYFISRFLIQYETENYIHVMQASLTQANSILQERVELLKQTATDLARSKAVLALLDRKTELASDAQMVETMLQQTIPALGSARLSNKYAHAVRLIHGNPRVYDVYDIIYFSEVIQSGAWRERLAGMYRDELYPLTRSFVEGIAPESDYFKGDGSGTRASVLSVYASVLSAQDNSLLGVVEALMDREVLVAPLREVALNEGEVLQMVDRAGQVVFSSDPDFALPPEAPALFGQEGAALTQGGASYRQYALRVSSIDAWLVQLVPARLAGIEKYKYVIGGILLVIGVAFSLACLALYRLFSRNIRKLIRGINRVETGELTTYVDIQSGDEIEEIATQFNRMTARVHELMQQEKQANEMERQAIYRALESQMKPHFLCNALDFIRMSTQVQGNHEIARAVTLVMEYFNYNMNRTSTLVTLQEELRNVEDFIGIYNLINDGRIEYVVDVGPELSLSLDLHTVIKYTLQPIVENAIKHAFAHKREKCFIAVEVERGQGSFGPVIRIGVEDNGGGMDGAQVEALQSSIYGPGAEEAPVGEKDYSGVGLRNIYRRLRLTYGLRCDLQIESYPGLGTKVTVVIPLSPAENG